MKAENEELKKSADNNTGHELDLIDSYLQSVRLEQPSVTFTQQVMTNLHQASPARMGLPSRNKILLLAAMLVMASVTILLLAGGAFSNVTSITFDQDIIPNNTLREYIPAIPFNGKLIMNVVILMNLGLAFIILDRAILRPWFAKRARVQY